MIVLLTEILETASVEVEIVQDNEIYNMSYGGLDRGECMSLLASQRNDSLRDHIHVIIGNSPDVNDLGNIGGKAFQYWKGITGTGSPSYGHYACRTMANSQMPHNNNEFLDRVGCFVFADRIVEIIDQGPAGTWDRWHGYHGALALITAHEIGHAMGITYHVDEAHPSPMFDPPFDSLVNEPSENYDKYKAFDGAELNNQLYQGHVFPQEKSSVNLRDLLGVHTVDIGS